MSATEDTVNLPEILTFRIEVKQSVRKTLASIDFEIEKRRLNWEMLLAEVHNKVSAMNFDTDGEDLSIEIISRMLKFFPSSRTNINSTILLNRDNMVSLFVATHKNYLSFFRDAKASNPTFRIRLLLLLSDMAIIQSGGSAATTVGPTSQRARGGKNKLTPRPNSTWTPNQNASRSRLPTALPSSFRINAILETNCGDKRQQCTIELNMPEVLEVYKAVERQTSLLNSTPQGSSMIEEELMMGEQGLEHHDENITM
eukprot:Awhi_evm1s15440